MDKMVDDCGDTDVVLGASPIVPVVKPLQCVMLDIPDGADGRLLVDDARGQRYVDRPAVPPTAFTVGGALGWQWARLVNVDGRVVREWRFRVECQTEIDDGGAGFGDLMRCLHLTMARVRPNMVAVDGKLYRFLVRCGNVSAAYGRTTIFSWQLG